MTAAAATTVVHVCENSPTIVTTNDDGSRNLLGTLLMGHGTADARKRYTECTHQFIVVS